MTEPAPALPGEEPPPVSPSPAPIQPPCPVERLAFTGFRNLVDGGLSLHPHLTVLKGDNAQGKTAVLEAAFLCSRGRSFRAARLEELHAHQTESPGFVVGAQVFADPLPRRLEARWTRATGLAIRLDEREATREDALATLPVQWSGARTEDAATGPAASRRAAWQWLMFHAEPRYWAAFKAARRLLAQRQRGLASEAPPGVLTAFEREAGRHLAELAALYDPVAELLAEAYRDALALLLPSTPIKLEFDPGGPPDAALAAAELSQARDRDRTLGYPAGGAHRAVARLKSAGKRSGVKLSRGQQRLAGLALALAQADVTARRGVHPLLLLDDLSAELDTPAIGRVLTTLAARPQQAVLTTLVPLPVAFADATPHALVRVEQGRLVSDTRDQG